MASRPVDWIADTIFEGATAAVSGNVAGLNVVVGVRQTGSFY
jgi:hypothetical protein